MKRPTEQPGRQDRHMEGAEDRLMGVDGYFTVTADGRLLAAKDPRRFAHDADRGIQIALNGSVALAAQQDRRFLWQIETRENLLSNKVSTPLCLGVDAEHVKSLFYAREAPTTSSGRKRPILHWVRAHERRLRTGIDIDISRHMRGITEFEMDGTAYRITSPDKAIERKAG